MKKIVLISLSVIALCSCHHASELPPVTDGYAREFVLTDPVNLTMEDREYLEALEKEYEEAIKK